MRPPLGKGTSHVSVADALDEAEVDTVVDPPRLEEFLNHVSVSLSCAA